MSFPSINSNKKCSTYLTPAWFNLIGFSPHFLNLLRNHCFCILISTPLLYGAHGLRIKFVHSGRLLLYVCDNGDISDCSLHQSLRHDSRWTLCIWLGLNNISKKYSNLLANYQRKQTRSNEGKNQLTCPGFHPADSHFARML